MMNGQYLVRDKNIAWRDVAGEVVIVPSTYSVHVLNKTASFIWKLADGTRCLPDIVTEICNRFEVDSGEAYDNAQDFCKQLLEKGYIQLVDSKSELEKA
jgi:hypothetical protein